MSVQFSSVQLRHSVRTFTLHCCLRRREQVRCRSTRSRRECSWKRSMTLSLTLCGRSRSSRTWEVVCCCATRLRRLLLVTSGCSTYIIDCIPSAGHAHTTAATDHPPVCLLANCQPPHCLNKFEIWSDFFVGLHVSYCVHRPMRVFL